MRDKPPLAHSPKGSIPAQTYCEHVTGVRNKAVQNAANAVRYYRGKHGAEAFKKYVEAAAVYHDLGKLDEANQSVLKVASRKPLPIAHEDAGAALLDKLEWKESAVLAFAHHEGLFSRDEEMSKQERPFRQLKRKTPAGEPVADHIDRNLFAYESEHIKSGCPTIGKSDVEGLHNCGLTRRIALSCLVDADHGNTAKHYYAEREIDPPKACCWEERLAALQSYVNGLDEGKTENERARNNLRRKVFQSCMASSIEKRIRTCDAPVGSGKTTAVMAHLLKIAASNNPPLRHIIIVLPYTNIITQMVNVYRKAMVLDGERPEDVVAEHHHRAEFADVDLRHIATLWKAPIIVTTAVQFFETLGASHPASLRKLHELPGSAVFIDEMHAAIPSHLWPQMWRWLEKWSNEWGGYLVLSSGSMSRFWDLKEYQNLMAQNAAEHALHVQDLIEDESLRRELKVAENRRILYRRRSKDEEALDCAGVVNFVSGKKGPRLLIVNTVQTAAAIANAMRNNGHDVLHLSTALAPVHRDLIINRIKQRLRNKIEDWTLVATSCVEAGMDFSFRNGFRERASTASLIQIGGRISRGAEYPDAEVWDILLRDDLFRENPTITISKRALGYFADDELNTEESSFLSTKAMQREWTAGADRKARELVKLEQSMEYPSVAKACRVIEADTRTVLIDQTLVNAIRNGRSVSKIEIMQYSVQIWAHKIEKLALEPIIPFTEAVSANSMYSWVYDYDADFLGYMAGVLKLDDFFAAGGGVI